MNMNAIGQPLTANILKSMPYKVLIMSPQKPPKKDTLETEKPLAEKDEVKEAEVRTMKQQKKSDQKPLKSKK